MSNELRDFLEIPYSELEELNLKAKEQRQEPRSNGEVAGGTSQVSDGREAN